MPHGGDRDSGGIKADRLAVFFRCVEAGQPRRHRVRIAGCVGRIGWMWRYVGGSWAQRGEVRLRWYL